MNTSRSHEGGDLGPPVKLDLLLREIARSEGSPGEAPDVESVVAYVEGSADEEQVRRIQAALAQSSQLRDEVLELMAQRERLDASREEMDAAAAGTDSVPTLAELVKQVGAEGSSGGGVSRPASPARMRRRAPWMRRRTWIGMAAAAVLALAVWPLLRESPEGPPAPLRFDTTLRMRLLPESTLRGEAASGRPALKFELGPGLENVELLLWVLPGWSTQPPSELEMSVALGDRVILERSPMAVEVIDGSAAVRLRLAAGDLVPGILKLTLEAVGADGRPTVLGGRVEVLVAAESSGP